jgi:hypothetical protein
MVTFVPGMKLRNRIRARPGVDTRIADPEHHTVIDERGAVRSIQAAYLTLPEPELEALWSPMHLERLARTYWEYLTRVSLGLIRIAYSPTERAVVFIRRPFVLLRFHPPEYELIGDRGIVRWRIRSGVLVARRGQEGDGYLEIDVRRVQCDRPGYAIVHIEVEVANFYPAIATWLTRFVYKQTQSRIHVLITHGFLRSLARLELEQSTVGRFASLGPEAVARIPSLGPVRFGADRSQRAEPSVIGRTRWPALAGIALTLAVLVRLVQRCR